MSNRPIMRSLYRLAGATAIALVTLSTSSLPIAAEDEIDSRRSGPYLGVSAGAALPNFDGETFFVPTTFQPRVQEEVSLEFLGRAGWRLHPNLAIEAQYEWMKGWDIDTKTTTCAELDAQVITGNVRVFAPFDSIHPYLMAGPGAGRYKTRVKQQAFDNVGNRCAAKPGYRSSNDDWEFAVRVGGGFDVYLTRNVLINLEASSVYSADRLLGETFPFVSISGGLGFRF